MLLLPQFDAQYPASTLDLFAIICFSLAQSASPVLPPSANPPDKPSSTEININQMATKNFKLLCLENPLLDIQGKG